MNHMRLKLSPQLQMVSDKLQDEESKHIYMQVLSFLKHGDNGGLPSPLDKLAETHRDRKIILYGAGVCGAWTHHYLQAAHNMSADCFCDGSESMQGSVFRGLPVISPDELAQEHSDGVIVISVTSGNARREIYDKLIGLGFPGDQICIAEPYQLYRAASVAGAPYFSLPFLRPVQNEVFLDVGCYNGETILDFARFCNGEYRKIYAAEPDTANCKCLEDCIRNNNIRNVEVVQKGVWSCDTTLYFDNSGGFSSRITGNGAFEIPVTTIDGILGGENVTYIKIDIEGAELEALKGAVSTIRRCKPRLAVSVYHKPEDIEEIPLFLSEVLPEYRFYMRHHTGSFVDTVLYAV